VTLLEKKAETPGYEKVRSVSTSSPEDDLWVRIPAIINHTVSRNNSSVKTRCSMCSAGDEVLAGDQTFQYFTSEDMKTLQDDSMCSTAKVSPHYLACLYLLT